MKWFILFVFLSYTGGLLFSKASPRLRSVLLLAACLLLTSIFFFLNRIY
jgi:hypothetical protein